MYYLCYTEFALKQKIKEIINSGIDISKPYFALLLFRDIDRQLISFLEDNWGSLHRSTGKSLHLLGPIEPLNEMNGKHKPHIPIAESPEGEGRDFYDKISEAGVNLDTLPLIVFFEIVESDGYRVRILHTLSLNKIEYKTNSLENYRKFFADIINISHKCFHDNKTSDKFILKIKNYMRRNNIVAFLNHDVIKKLVEKILDLIPL